MSCTWQIHAPVGKRVFLSFDYIDLEACEGCGCDSLAVFDGASASNNAFPVLCGTAIPSEMYSSSSQDITVKFLSDLTVTYTGFNVTVRFLDQSKPNSKFYFPIATPM
jgi:hypothetical protein